MKIKDQRDGTIFEGELIDILKPFANPSDADILKYYKTTPADSQYIHIKRACDVPRMVLHRGEAEDPQYYILPRYSFYVEVKDVPV